MQKRHVVFSVIVAVLLLMTGTAWADSIPINNASFENYSPNPFTNSCGPGCGYNSGSIPGWNVTSGGSFQPGSFYNYIPDGSVVGFTNGGSISQTLTGTSVSANSSYTLTVFVGNRTNKENGVFSIYLDTILNGITTTLCSVSGNAATFTPGTWQAESCTYNSGANAPAGNFYLDFVGGNGQLNVDDVTLTNPTTNVPEPSSLLLLGFGALLVMGMAKWNHEKQVLLNA